MGRNQSLSISIEQAVPPEELAKEYKSGRVFLYPSFHEDENYGLAPREAALSGAIPVVSDICGLGEFGRTVGCECIDTWPTLGGIRYSLRQLASKVSKMLSQEEKPRQLKSEANWDYLNPDNYQDNVEKLRQQLISHASTPAIPAPKGGWRCPERQKYLTQRGPRVFRKPLSEKNKAEPAGLNVDGLGIFNPLYSASEFLAAIQGLYTTWPVPPKVTKGLQLHGFWRIGLWDQEKALVEFGYPGPRFLLYSSEEWTSLRLMTAHAGNDEIKITPKTEAQASILQQAVDFGYLVPDVPNTLHFTC